MRDKSIEDDYDLVSFDVTSLFTNVPLDVTIDNILNKIYSEEKVKTKLKKEEMRQLLNICTKDIITCISSSTKKSTNKIMASAWGIP